MHCEKCGEKISEESVFCEFCGNKIQEEKGVSKTAAIISEENTKDAGIIQRANGREPRVVLQGTDGNHIGGQIGEKAGPNLPRHLPCRQRL